MSASYQLLQQQYRFADLIRDKLNNCTRGSKIDHKEYNLRKIVCNANLLDNVLRNIDDIKLSYIRKQEDFFKDNYLKNSDYYAQNGEFDEDKTEDGELDGTIVRPVPTRMISAYGNFGDLGEEDEEDEEEDEEDGEDDEDYINPNGSNYTYSTKTKGTDLFDNCPNEATDTEHAVDSIPRSQPAVFTPTNPKLSVLRSNQKQPCIFA